MRVFVRYCITAILLLSFSINSKLPVNAIMAAEPPAETADVAAEAKSDTELADTESASEEAEEIDPLAVPDASVDELFKFITKTMRETRQRNRTELPAAVRAIIDAAAKIRTIDGVTVKEEVRAIRQQLQGLSLLARIAPEGENEFNSFVESLAADERPEIKAIGAQQLLQADIRAVGSMSKEAQQGVIAKVNKVLDENGPSRLTYSLGTQLARGLQNDSPDLAISVYEDLASRLESSDDEKIQDLAERVRGSARQLKLMGNPIELSGPTDRGEPFDWNSYRGKVVLVDFWASWCGPCRGEIPNMKRNLIAYADDFDIVGINMDKTIETMGKYIASEEIDWVNIIGEDETGTGWNHPIARYYGVSGIPKAILVDREGRVVSLSARGKKLDKLLAEMIGPLPETSSDQEDENEGDDRKDGKDAEDE